MTFKQQMTEDLDVFMNTDEFAVTAVHNGNDVNGQFVEQVFDGPENTDAFYKLFICKLSSVPGLSNGDVIEVGGTVYRVTDFNIDDMGDTVSLFLSEEL